MTYYYRINMKNGITYLVESPLVNKDLFDETIMKSKMWYQFNLYKPSMDCSEFNTVLIYCEEISSIEYITK